MNDAKRSLRPGSALFGAALAALLCGALAFFAPSMMRIWTAATLGILVFAAADALVVLFFTGHPRIERRIGTSHAQGIPSNVELVITFAGFRARTLVLFDLYDDLFDCAAFPASVRLPRVGAARTASLSFQYLITPVERGAWVFPACDILIPSVLRFWRLKVCCPCVSRGRIYPDFRLLARSSGLRAVLALAGDKSVRKRGEGLEFDYLRDWQPGDSVRAIDWRATSRRGKAIIRQYIEEQDQQVFFVLDAGYRLHRQHEFDDALGAALLLSWAALKHGDAAGGAVFGSDERWISPRHGMAALARIMNALYDAKSAPAPSSVAAALETALARLKRRSFIVLVSNFREEDEEQLTWILRHAGSRHLLLIVNIREPEAELLARNSAARGEDALVAAAARAYLEGRRRLLTRWEALGFLTLECTARSLSAELINRYLLVKRAGFL